MNIIAAIDVFFSLVFFPACIATFASPHGFREKQPDGSLTPKLFIHGDADLHYITDSMGYIVTQNEQKWYVYARHNRTLEESYPNIEPGADPVGRHKRRLGQIHKKKYLQYMIQHQQYSYRRDLLMGSLAGRIPITHGILKNLVVLLCFADHKNRTLPSPSDISVLYNKIGGDPRIAPSGSVRDVFLKSSYAKLDILSHVYGWIDLPYDESYYADGKTGDSDKFLQAIHYSLSVIDMDDYFSLKDFDRNQDGFIDSISFLHSGYGAEWGGVDCLGTNFLNRIWSHQLDLAPRFHWRGHDSVAVDSYHISSTFYGSCGNAIARIGTLSHELGHFLSLKDLYDRKGGGLGVGSYCLMGDSWGFDGSQLYPGIMSVWSKIELGWVSTKTITSDGRYELQMSQLSDIAYRIDYGFPEGEYLLLENRQSEGFDQYLDQGGIAIWHIDNKSDQTNPGFPGQYGWPSNGNHYKVALIQADGKYELERGFQFRGKGDLFHSNGKNSIGPSIDANYGPFPNTDSYQSGIIKKTGIFIHDIGESGYTMLFNVTFQSVDETVEKELRQLVTTYNTNSGMAGNMFSIVAKRDLTIYGFNIHMLPIYNAPLHILMKSGSYKGFEHDENSWVRLMNTNITGNGITNPTKILLFRNDRIRIGRNQKLSFYITLESNAMRYTIGTYEGKIVSANDDLNILEGNGMEYPFGNVYSPRIWNGAILYDVSFVPPITSNASEYVESNTPSDTPTEPATQIISPSPSFAPATNATMQSGTEERCPKPKEWSAWKSKCVPRCRKREGKQYSWNLDKCVKMK